MFNNVLSLNEVKNFDYSFVPLTGIFSILSLY